MGSKTRSASKGFAFVIADTHGKPNLEDRKLIRSHVMRGKNTSASRVGVKHPTSRVTKTNPKSIDEIAPPASESQSGSRRAPRRPNKIENTLMLQVPLTSNGLSMFQFADVVDSASRAQLFEFYSVVKEVMYPIDVCMHFDVSKTPWFHWLFSDAAYLHSILFTVGLLHDVALGGKLSKKTSFHVWKTLNLLTQNIADQDLALADSTVATIVSMCMVAELFGDHQSAAAHVAGMHQIVELRGGIQSFQHNLQLQIKICRVDIGWCLCAGGKPLYFRDNLSWESAFAPVFESLPGGIETHHDRGRIRPLLSDRRMGNIFQDLHDFSCLANSLFQTKRRVEPGLFQKFMISIQYRLLHMDLATQGIVATMFHLAMICYFTTFFLNISGVKIKMISMASKLRSVCQQLEAENLSTDGSRLVFAWALVVGAMSVFEEQDDTWLLPKLAGLHDTFGKTWPEAKESLQEVMWISNIHDIAGIRVFKRLVLHVAEVPTTRGWSRRG